MDSTGHFPSIRRRATALGSLAGAMLSSRAVVYLVATAAAVIANLLLGKEMMGDTLDYHLYAGFSALHDRFNLDYFPAGPQSYFNPYVYVPFYLLATSSLSALAASSLLAVVQSAIIWLTYELAVALAPEQPLQVRHSIGICAALLAFANPILIGQLGSSYADVLTAELVLAGWLLLLRAIRSPHAWLILAGGTILGAASALKLTNSGHALSAFALLAFIPGDGRRKVLYVVACAAAIAIGFLAIAAPWAVHLQQQFGNPLFPLLNGLFRSSQYPTAGMLDHRFIPDSLSEALARPFALLAPKNMVDNEFPSPDLRYALLALVSLAMVLRWTWVLLKRPRAAEVAAKPTASMRSLGALGCAFLVDWIIWLSMSGNGRYFIAMACVAAVVAILLLFRLFAGHPGARNCVLGTVLCIQAVQLSMGAVFRSHIRWDGGSWFEVGVPRKLAVTSNLYFTFGAPDAFIAAFLARSSGFINIGGSYELGPRGANGARVNTLIRRFAPRLQVLMRDSRSDTENNSGPPDLRYVNDALEPFSLRADPVNCARVAVQDVIPGPRVWAATGTSKSLPMPDTGYLLTCPVIADHRDRSAVRASERSADLVFDRIEDACPGLFQPARQVSRNYSGSRAEVWARQYSTAGLEVFVGPGGVDVVDTVRGGTPAYLGRESEWLNEPPRLACGRVGEHFHARTLRPSLEVLQRDHR